MTSRGLRRALPVAAAVTAVVAGALYIDLRDEGGRAGVDRTAVAEARLPASSAVPAIVPDAAPVQQPGGTMAGAPADAAASPVPEVAGDMAEPAQGYPAPVGPHVEVGDSPALTGESGASAAAPQVYTEGVAPAPERLRSGAEPEATGELPATAR
jgi:hypothetical protein